MAYGTKLKPAVTDFLFFPLQMEEDGELPKTLVKLRRTTSDTPRPASTPPVIAASANQGEDEEEKMMAELEVGPGVCSVSSDVCQKPLKISEITAVRLSSRLTAS